MKMVDVTVVRIYMVEGDETLTTVLNYLRKEIKICGLSIFRAISGCGETGTHTASLLDLSFSLPLIVEFFDSPEKISTVLEHLATIVKPEHMLFFPAKVNG
ncbi:DUF190 domain-containing protein [Legionella jamestowniensis]|uniref:Uncharacterized protein n=1 Tax=Legionella jamestowniensis TaxID=455 RepID=A0A0W0UZG2_9GAMM|nr:DUF190 domain-containing protein [Legionella jamestowniensis]KTD13251.1 hypothetical protein Ljam_0041 [Legionella jamestowniensis]OCH98282.1 hypothetical protein A8135_12040 [Legionella jamestowniensis]SFL78079.1 hypothetical protein SAMN02746073_1887 [Legionella jamestowniensis DSM 19215]